ncbi:MarR family transcriptional regulator [Jeotgalibacillus sp. ET6]|uniref:MarR family winged helix-turn-helix transcriptional regulator n=1 Tax=Jeotgalibacillus sp. ET6 TaxID=3037260 RepID=UPI0024185923|nr:MarR family transcriptional regulator [Jeotgalibacillus sp. ET6]MDG5471249.1 MarR family transcriptional regulator [Jeotgalibacillus sp. ET6]
MIMKGMTDLKQDKKQQIQQMYRQIDELDLLLTQYFMDLNEFELTYQQEQVLMLFKRQDTWTTTELALRMNISKSGISQVLKVLENRGFVKKEKNPNNLRESFIQLDSLGHAFSARVNEIEEQLTDELFSVLGDEEVVALSKSFQNIITHLTEKKKREEKAEE